MRLPVDNSFYDPSTASSGQKTDGQQAAKKRQHRSPKQALGILDQRLTDLEESDTSHAERLAELDIGLKAYLEKQGSLFETQNEAAAAIKAINSWIQVFEEKQALQNDQTAAHVRNLEEKVAALQAECDAARQAQQKK
eukprot:3081916-Rhodomonas_salina.1